MILKFSKVILWEKKKRKKKHPEKPRKCFKEEGMVSCVLWGCTYPTFQSHEAYAKVDYFFLCITYLLCIERL